MNLFNSKLLQIVAFAAESAMFICCSCQHLDQEHPGNSLIFKFDIYKMDLNQKILIVNYWYADIKNESLKKTIRCRAYFGVQIRRKCVPQYANPQSTALPCLYGGRVRTEHTPVFSSEKTNIGKYKSLPFHLHLWKE